MNCSSTIGRSPAAARPMPAPAIVASASGALRTRPGCRVDRPLVKPNTPPFGILDVLAEDDRAGKPVERLAERAVPRRGDRVLVVGEREGQRDAVARRRAVQVGRTPSRRVGRRPRSRRARTRRRFRVRRRRASSQAPAAELAVRHERRRVAFDRVARAHRRDVLRAAVDAMVVAVGVRRHAVELDPQERRAAAVARPGDRLAGAPRQQVDVAPVHRRRVRGREHAEAHRQLVARRRADAVAVVLDDEHDRQLELDRRASAPRRTRPGAPTRRRSVVTTMRALCSSARAPRRRRRRAGIATRSAWRAGRCPGAGRCRAPASCGRPSTTMAVAR